MNWISVNDKLPDVDLSVIVYNGYKVTEACLLKNKQWLSGDGAITGVIYWMFMPQPPNCIIQWVE